MPHIRIAFLFTLALPLAGCGLGETAATAELEAKQAAQAQQQMQQVTQQIDQANAQEQQRLDDAEKAAQ
ncbi:hypothetical protein [Pseudomonas knackmussii]|uniref:hypothetical protein n=1 Tax=Pseudomonas knackmussii TaxID=65741 RepID=UPI003F49FF00